MTADFFLPRDGPVVVTSDRGLREGAADWPTTRGGDRAHRWTLASEGAFHREVSETFDWLEKFGCFPWTGNLDALNDGVSATHRLGSNKVVLVIDNAGRLKRRFGTRSGEVWKILRCARRMNLIFGVGVIVLAHARSQSEIERWTKADGGLNLTRKSFHSRDFRDGV